MYSSSSVLAAEEVEYVRLGSEYGERIYGQGTLDEGEGGNIGGGVLVELRQVPGTGELIV